MKIKYCSAFFLFIIALLSCKNTDLITQQIDIAKSIGTNSINDLDLEDLFRVEVYRLPINDRFLLADPQIYDVDGSIIGLFDNNILYLYDMSLSDVICVINNSGDGPGEYNFITSARVISNEKTIIISDTNKDKLFTYDFSSKLLREQNVDFIADFDIRIDNTLIVTYDPTKLKSHLIGIYNKDLDLIQEMFPTSRNENFSNKGFVFFNSIQSFSDKSYFRDSFSDTLFSITDLNIKAELIINCGKFKLPENIGIDFNMREKAELKFMRVGSIFVFDNLVFIKFYFKQKLYFDIWNKEVGSLVYRNVAVGPESIYGIPLLVDGVVRNFWPSYTDSYYLYGLVDGVNDENPTLLRVKLK